MAESNAIGGALYYRRENGMLGDVVDGGMMRGQSGLGGAAPLEMTTNTTTEAPTLKDAVLSNSIYFSFSCHVLVTDYWDCGA